MGPKFFGEIIKYAASASTSDATYAPAVSAASDYQLDVAPSPPH